MFYNRAISTPLEIRWRISDSDFQGSESVDLWKQAMKNMLSSWTERKEMFEKQRIPVSCKMGDFVMKKSHILSSLKEKITESLC